MRNIVQARFVGRGAGGGSAPTAMAAAAPAQGVKSVAAAGTNVKPSAATQKQASNTSGTTTGRRARRIGKARFRWRSEAKRPCI